MDVWVLTETYPHENEMLNGVYATREEAERFAAQIRLSRGAEWCIYKVGLGEVPRARTWRDRLGNEED